MTVSGPPGHATSAMAADLPQARGPLSDAILRYLTGPYTAGLRAEGAPAQVIGGAREADPYGDDLQLALYACYEMHYHGFSGVDPDLEWDPELLRMRAALEKTFLAGLRADVAGGTGIDAALDALLVEPADGNGVTHYLRDRGTWWQMREYLVQRSLYHLKEADPHAWVIPRLDGQAKASLVAVEFDEFGGGHAARAHAQLFADLMRGAGLDARYLGYLDHASAPMLATVNAMSLLGLHRSLRGGLVGGFAAAEITTAPSARRMAQALERLEAPPECIEFFTEHIEADAVHEQVMRHDVIGDLLLREPALTADVVFGVQVADLLEEHLSGHLLGSWEEGNSSLRRPLPGFAIGPAGLS